MLLSSTKFTRTMMDDFVDQDWFEESAEDEVVKHHPMAGVEQQQPQPSPLHIPLENGFGCFHSAPSHGQTDFLELNVPVDELFFGTAEMAAPQLAELDTNNQQKMTNCFSSNAKVVQEVQQKVPQIDGHQLSTQTQFGTMGGANGHVQQNGLGMQQREPFYADWPPTTSSSFTTTGQPMPNAMKIHKQNGRDEQQQRNTQQQQSWTMPLGDTNGSGQSQYEQQQNQYGGAQSTKLSGTNGSNAFPMARIIVHDQSTAQFPQQSFGCDTIELHQNALFHNNFSSPCNASNNQNVPKLYGQQQQQIVIAEEPIQQPHFLQRAQNVTEFRPVQNPLKTTKRPSKAKPSANNSQKSTAFGPGHAQSSSGPNLDQVAAQLFSNSNLATVQFDAQRAIEFAQVLEQTKLFREQEEQGIDVHAQLRACEARIAELVQNAMAQQGNGITAPIATTTQGTTAKKKSKAKKKPPPKAEQQQNNVQRMNGMAQPMQMKVFSAVPLSNGPGPSVSTCHQRMVPLPPHEVICQPSTGNAIDLSITSTNKFKQYPVHSALPSASSSSFSQPFPSSSSLQPNSVPKNSASSSLSNFNKLSSPPVSADATPLQQKSSKNEVIRLPKRQSKKEEKSEAQKAQERERERLLKEKERERRRTKLSDAFSVLRSSIPTLDYKTPFSDKMDCIKRLLPFGLFAETELSDDFLQKFDGELQRHSEFLCERMDSLKDRFQSVFFTEALCEMKEQSNLLLRLDIEFEKAQHQKAVKANGVSFPFPIASSSNLLDWEYDDGWDRNRYRNISPFTSPAHSPQNDAKFGGEIKDEITDDGETAQREEEQRGEAEGEDEAATPSAKIGTIRLTLPTYTAEEDKGIKEDQTDGRRHSPNGEKSEHDQGDMEQNLHMDNSEIEEKHDEVAFCSPKNEVQVTPLLLDDPLSVHSFAPSESPQHFHAAAIPAEVPPVSSTPEIFSNQFLCQNNASPSNCDKKVVEIDDGDSVVKAIDKSLLFTSKEGPEYELADQQKSQKEELREKEKEKQRTESTEPVKLTIKLDKKNMAISNGIEERSDNRNGKEEENNGRGKEERKEVAEKLERKRLKAEKKEKKRQAKLEKERMKKAQKERQTLEGEQQPNSSLAQLQNGERPAPPLKLSLRRLACWRGTNNNVTPEYCSNLSHNGIHSNGQPADLPNGGIAAKRDDAQIKPESANDPLKLRISKLILNKTEQNRSGEAKSVEHRKKSRKRKSHEGKSHSREQRVTEEEESPKKVPKLKIRIGNECSDEKKQSTSIQPNADASQNSTPKREKSQESSDNPMEKVEHFQTKSSSPQSFFLSNDSNRIQFSPCCSEKSDDDELRVRTNELFSKLCQD